MKYRYRVCKDRWTGREYPWHVATVDPTIDHAEYGSFRTHAEAVEAAMVFASMEQ